MKAFLFSPYQWIKAFCSPNYIEHTYTYFWSGTTCILERMIQRFLYHLLEKWSRTFCWHRISFPRGLSFYHIIKYLKPYKALQHREKKPTSEVWVLIHLLVIISCQVWQKDKLSLQSSLSWGSWWWEQQKRFKSQVKLLKMHLSVESKCSSKAEVLKHRMLLICFGPVVLLQSRS